MTQIKTLKSMFFDKSLSDLSPKISVKPLTVVDDLKTKTTQITTQVEPRINDHLKHDSNTPFQIGFASGYEAAQLKINNKLKAINSFLTMFTGILSAIKEIRYEISEVQKTDIISNVNNRTSDYFISQNKNNKFQLAALIEKTLDQYKSEPVEVTICCNVNDYKQINELFGCELSSYLTPDESIEEGDFQIYGSHQQVLGSLSSVVAIK